MIPLNSTGKLTSPFNPINPRVLTIPLTKSCFLEFRPVHCFHQEKPKTRNPKTPHMKNHTFISPNQVLFSKNNKKVVDEEKRGFSHIGSQEMMMILCGFGYWVQGFRCLPWLALNFHMAHNLNLHPSTLQLVQNTGNLPMVAKPLYGILSDALYIGGAHRLPYISIGG